MLSKHAVIPVDRRGCGVAELSATTASPGLGGGGCIRALGTVQRLNVWWGLALSPVFRFPAARGDVREG